MTVNLTRSFRNCWLHYCYCYCYGVLRCIATISDLLWALLRVLITPDSSTGAIWQLPAETPSSEAGENGLEMAVNLPMKYLLSYLYGSLTCRNILRHGTVGFTSPPHDVVLRTIIALKIHCPWPGLNPPTLGRKASTLTIRPLRATWLH
jgi:hypothetical protein